MSLAVVAVSLQAAGMVSGGISAYYGARSQKSGLQFQSEMGEINARLSDLSAKQALVQGEREEQKVRMASGQVKAGQRVALAANGIDMTSATAQAQLTTTDVLGEIDAMTVKENAIRSAWGYRTQATNARTEAMVQRSMADGISAGRVAFSSLLGSAGQVAGSWYQMNKDGAFRSSGGSSGGTPGVLNVEAGGRLA